MDGRSQLFLDEHEDPARFRACRAFFLFSFVVIAGFITAFFVLGVQFGRGTGFGDGQLAPSCYTPGGPYYVAGVTQDPQQCPHGISTPGKRPGQQLPRSVNG
jgi:hypothetical protein